MLFHSVIPVGGGNTEYFSENILNVVWFFFCMGEAYSNCIMSCFDPQVGRGGACWLLHSKTFLTEK